MKDNTLEYAAIIDGNDDKRKSDEGLEFAAYTSNEDAAKKYTREWIEQRIAEQEKLENRNEPKKLSDLEFEKYYSALLKIIKG